MTALLVLDYLGVALFAATGALAASRKQLDIVGFLFLGSLTGMGGGTVRDLVLDAPVFWVAQPFYVVVCAATAVGVYLGAPLLESRYRWLLWFDAAALSAYGVFGAWKGFALTGSPVVAVVMGMLTGVLGGILRDVVANEPSVLLRRGIYVSATLAGGTVFVLSTLAGLPPAIAAAVGFTAAFLLRGGGIAFGWSLPAYRSRPGRPAPPPASRSDA